MVVKCRKKTLYHKGPRAPDCSSPT